MSGAESHRIRYLRGSAQAHHPARPSLVLVHGFGGNADHWRRNIADLTRRGFNVYAVDLLGFGKSDKPSPDPTKPNEVYRFDTWGLLLADFLHGVVGGPAHLVCNSIGGIVGLRCAEVLHGEWDEAAAAEGRSPWATTGSAAEAADRPAGSPDRHPRAGAEGRPGRVLSVQLLDVSLRMLHVDNQVPLVRPLIAAFQRFLRENPAVGAAFFGRVATASAVRAVLREAYGDPSQVTDELVDIILTPGLDPRAAPVFLDFISYSSGPLPGECLKECPPEVPTVLLWGEKDPWELAKWGRELFAKHACEGGTEGGTVAAFVALPGVGHCPMCEAPELVNPLVAEWALRLGGG